MKRNVVVAVIALCAVVQMQAMDPRCKTIAATGTPPRKPDSMIRSCPSGKVEKIPGYKAGTTAHHAGGTVTEHSRKR